MYVNWIKILMIGALVLLLAGCSPFASQGSVDGAVSPSAADEELPGNTSTPAYSTPTTQEATTPMSQTLPLPAGLQNLIDRAKEDLAERLSLPLDQISLVEAEAVVWPDASLGCPQPGMAYAQVLTPGYLIRLEIEGKEYEYHASRGTQVVYCENPSPPVAGTPGDT